ncbi:MAG TPA: restriction endonuclease [Verrucomicrobiae bacterium]|nr:restriction endonuclease [Verrucomicrobiae bacterium]
MARRRKRDNDWLEPIVAFVSLVVLATVFIPNFRPIFFAVGIIALIAFAVVAFGAIVIGIHRLATTERRMQPMAGNVFTLPAHAPDKKTDGDESKSKQPPEPPTTAGFIEQLRSMDWFQFEKVVGHVYQKLGYTVTRRGGANPDGGIDLVIEKDGQRIAVQCKQWKTWNVGVKAIREFLGALTDAGTQKGIFITLRGYTGDARQLAEKHGIEIVNEVGLTQMLESTDARFDPDVLELLHDTRKFCPKCERELVIRVAEKGPNPGSKFWGCSGYPRCHFTLPID